MGLVIPVFSIKIIAKSAEPNPFYMWFFIFYFYFTPFPPLKRLRALPVWTVRAWRGTGRAPPIRALRGERGRAARPEAGGARSGSHLGPCSTPDFNIPPSESVVEVVVFVVVVVVFSRSYSSFIISIGMRLCWWDSSLFILPLLPLLNIQHVFLNWQRTGP